MNNLFRILTASIFFILTLSIFIGCGEEKKVVVGMDPDYPPMGFINENNQAVGFDVDLANETFKRMNYRVEFKSIDWANKEAILNSGQIDLIWNGLAITEERQKSMLFSNPYLNGQEVIVTRKDNDSIMKEEDIAGKIVGMQRDSGVEEYFAEDRHLLDSVQTMRTYIDAPSAFQDILNGKIDAFICDELIGRYYNKLNQYQLKVIIINSVGAKTPIGIGFRTYDKELRDEVQKSLNSVIEDGTGTKISMDWFGEDLLIKPTN